MHNKKLTDAERTEVIDIVYERFMESEEDLMWTDLDDNLEWFSILTDKELVNETEIKLFEHAKGTLRCKQEHSHEYCFAPLILEAAQSISLFFKKSKVLSVRHKYVLTYYMALSELRLIYTLT